MSDPQREAEYLARGNPLGPLPPWDGMAPHSGAQTNPARTGEQDPATSSIHRSSNHDLGDSNEEYDPANSLLGNLPSADLNLSNDAPFGSANMLGNIMDGQDDGDNNHAGGNGSMGQGDIENDETTTSALQSLFNASNTVQTNPTTNEGSNTEMSIDPALQEPVPEPRVDNNAESQKNEEGRDSSAGPARVKKKATSRANMLTRGGACEFCKRRKLRCSAETPACSACIRAGKTCVYSQKKQKSRVRELEDRLAELEKKLDPSASVAEGSEDVSPRNRSEGGEQPTEQPVQEPTTMYDIESMNLDGTAAMGDSTAYDLFFSSIQASATDGGFNFTPDSLFGRTENSGSGAKIPAEPDLMTLADAAAADGRAAATAKKAAEATVLPWEKEELSAETIGREIVFAAEGTKGTGEAIVKHLLQLYMQSSTLPFISSAVDASKLLSRRTTGEVARETSVTHPTLILSIMPLLLPLSPSSALSDPERIKKITAKIIPPYKFHYQHALITSDPRQLDLIAASYINGMVRYLDGRLLEARTEIGLAVSLVWATGIGKLGMVGEDLTKNMGDKDRQGFISRRIGTREDLSDAFVHRSTSIEPPTDLVEYDRRVKLFWQVYILDKAVSIATNQPSFIEDEEVSTPFPKTALTGYYRLDPGASGVAFVGGFSVLGSFFDFFGGHCYTGETDNIQCMLAKSISLLAIMTRMMDKHLETVVQADWDKLEKVHEVAKTYLASVPAVSSEDSPSKQGQVYQVLHILRTTIMLTIVKENINGRITPTPKNLGKTFFELVSASIKDLNAHPSLEGYDAIGLTAWKITGNFVRQLGIWLRAEGHVDGDKEEAQVKSLADLADLITQLATKMTASVPFGKLVVEAIVGNTPSVEVQGPSIAVGV